MSTKTGFCLHCVNETVTLAEVRPMRQSWRVENLRRSGITNGPDADLVTRFKRASGRLTNMVADTEIGHAIVSLPALRGKARERALAGVVARDKGGAPGDWRLSWQQFGEAGREGQRNHFLLFANRTDLAIHTKRLQQWGLTASQVLPEFLVLDQFFRRHGADHAELDGWAVVFVGRHRQFLNIGTREVPLVVRALPDDLSQGADRGEYVERLATEIDRSIYFARQTEHNPRIQRIFVCGDPDLVAPLVRQLGETTAVEAVAWSLAELFTSGPHAPEPDDLLLLMGAALNFDNLDFNLAAAPGALRLGRAARRRLEVGLVAGGLALLPLLIGGGLVTSHVQRDYLDTATERLAAAQNEARQAEQVYQAQKLLLAREDRMATVAETRPDMENVLLELAGLTPPSVLYRSLEISERGNGHIRLRIEGTSEARTSEEAQAAFLRFLANLDGCDFLLRRTEPRLLKMKPGEGTAKGRKTTMFRVDLFLKRETPDKETSA